MPAEKEREFGKFDCVYHDPDARTPVMGKLSVFETALLFSGDIFGVALSGSSMKVKLRDVATLRAESRLSLVVERANGKTLSLSFTNSAPAFDCLVKSWNLTQPNADERVATGPGKDKKKSKGDGRASGGLAEMVQEYRESAEKKLQSFVAELSLLGAKPKPAPRLPVIDVEDEVSRCLFVRVVKATDVLAMDSGGTSDPFTSVRYRGLESTTKTIYETLNPEWDEVFTFRVPPNKISLDETDALEFHLFDRDVALNDFIGYTKLDLTGTKVYGTRRTRSVLKLGPLPKDQQPDFFDVNHLKEKLMFWEGERTITGTVEVEYWLGNRHDEEYRVAGVPVLRKPDPKSGEAINHFCDPVSALLRVEVKAGRNIINLDDDDGSDPYVEVILVQPDGTEHKQQTHYIDDATDPEWNRTFNFIAAKPYSSELIFRMYDYDGATSYDDLIGEVKIPISKLKLHTGIGQAPEREWHTLLDAEGKDADAEGTKYGDLQIRAYLDEEYFEHLHGGNTSKAVGRLTVDVLEGIDLVEPQDAFVMVKTGPYWSRLPDKTADANPQWNIRLRYPIMEPSDPVTVGLFSLSKGTMIGRIKVILSTLDDGLRYEDDFPLKMMKGGVVETVGKLRASFTFKHKSGTVLAYRYAQPVLPDKWYLQPLTEIERRQMMKAHSSMIMKRLYNSNPSIPESVSKELLDFSKQEVSIKGIKSSIARIERVVTNLTSVGDNFSYVFSWESIPLTAFAQLVMVFVIHHPNTFLPMILLSIVFQSLMRFPSRHQRVLERCVPDNWLSVGMAFAPESAEELEIKRQAEEAERKRLEEERKRQAEREKERRKEEAEAKAIEMKEKEEKKEKQAFTFESLNPLAALQRQMDEISHMIQDAQVVLDDAAGVLERIACILDWDEPRITACVVLALVIIAWALIFIDVVVRFMTNIVLGVFMKTFFTIFSPRTIKWSISAGFLFTMRHPAILPDAATAAIEEDKAARKAALASASSSGAASADAQDQSDEQKASLMDPRPLPPLNVFYRIPTSATRIL